MYMGNSKSSSQDISIIDNRNYNHNLGMYPKSYDQFFITPPVKKDQNLHFQIKELERSNDISRLQMKSMMNIKDDENQILKMKIDCLSKELHSIRSSQVLCSEQKPRFKSIKSNKSNTTYTVDDEVKDSCCTSSEDTVQKESVVRMPSRIQYDGEQGINDQNIYSQLLSFFQRVDSNQVLRKLCNGCMSNYRTAVGMMNQRRYGDLLVQSLQALNTLVDGLTRIKIDVPEEPKFKPLLTHHKQSRSLYVNLGYQDQKQVDDQCLSPSFDATQKNQMQKNDLLNFDLNEFLDSNQSVKGPPPFDKNSKMNSISPIREDVHEEVRPDNKSSKIKTLPSNLKNRNKLMPCQQKTKRTEGSFGIKK